MPEIIQTAEPFYFPGDHVGCLLVHGFTGAPKEMRWLGEYLHQQGFTVLGIRLAGHATRPDDMRRSRNTDWLASVEDGFHLLSGSVKHIYLMGLSMGGALSLATASYLPAKGVVAMSTPYLIPAPKRLKYVDLIAFFIPYLPKTKGEKPDTGWFDPDAWKEHISYPRNPTHAVGQLDKLLAKMRATLPQVKVPVLLIHSRDDQYVWQESMPSIYRDLGSPDKQMLWIEKSGHVITRDAQRETVFKAAADFVRRIEKITK